MHHDLVCVSIDEIHIPDKVRRRVLRDVTQIEQMRMDFERGRRMVRVVLRRRCGGGYNIEDGRHRVLAALAAGESHIEAIIVG